MHGAGLVIDMPRVFISHSSKDRRLVEQAIIYPLRQNSIETWYSTEVVKTADEWERQILDGLKKCDWFLVAMTPHAMTSRWVQREVHWAIEKREGKIIPVMLETCEPEELHIGLFSLQYIDFRHDIAQAQERLLTFWEVSRATQAEKRYGVAQEALAREDWAMAVEQLENVLRLDPSHAKARSELSRARGEELAGNYAVGITHMRARRWREALENLRRVRSIEKNYKDVADLIADADAELAKEEPSRRAKEQQETEGIERSAWRSQYDSTTNWAIATAGAIAYFVFSSPTNPHFVIPLGSLLVIIFLLSEVSRYNDKVTWREAIGQRLRRAYLWVFILLTAMWYLKVYLHPVPAYDLNSFVDRATVGIVPGELVVLSWTVFNLAVLIIALITKRFEGKS